MGKEEIKQLKISTGAVKRCGAKWHELLHARRSLSRYTAFRVRRPLELPCVARSVMKDLKYSDKEIAKQQERIEGVKADPEKDEYDVKKQNEVLQEYEAGKQDEQSRLLEFYDKLMTIVVSSRRHAKGA